MTEGQYVELWPVTHFRSLPDKRMKNYYIALAVIFCVSILYVLWSDKGFREERARARLEDDERKSKPATHKQRRDRRNK